jgi:hypothetical protein
MTNRCQHCEDLLLKYGDAVTKLAALQGSLLDVVRKPNMEILEQLSKQSSAVQIECADIRHRVLMHVDSHGWTQVPSMCSESPQRDFRTPWADSVEGSDSEIL